MEDLEADFGVMPVDGVGDRLERPRLAETVEDRGLLVHPPVGVGRIAPGHDQPGAALRPGGKIGGLARDGVVTQFEPRVHRPHDDAVGKPRAADIERPQEMRVAVL